MLPGLSPQVPTNFSLTGTIVGGPLSGVLNALVNSVEIIVNYSVTGGPPTDPSPPNPPGPNFVKIPDLSGGPEPLDVDVLLRPLIVDDTQPNVPVDYQIQVDLTVNIEGRPLAHTGPPPNPPPILIPVSMPALEIPAVLLLSDHVGDAPGHFRLHDAGRANRILVMVKAGSQLGDLGAVVGAVNRLTETLETLKDVLGWSASLVDFTGALSLVVSIINTVPFIYFNVGNARDLGNFNGHSWLEDLFGTSQTLDDDVSAWLLIGVTGTQAAIMGETDFNGGTAETMKVIDVGGSITTGVGVGNNMHRGSDSGESVFWEDT